MMAGLTKAPCSSIGRTTPLINRTEAPVTATISGRTLSQINATTTAIVRVGTMHVAGE